MNEIPLGAKIVVVFTALLALLVLERIYSKAKWPQSPLRRQRLFNNAGLWLLNTLLSPLIVIPVTAYASQHVFNWRPEWLSGWYGLIADLVVLDLAIYAWHVANHRVSFLWRFHRIHHLDEFLDVTSAVRFHFGEVVLSASLRAVVIIALGVPLSSVIIFETLVLIAAAFHHSNINLPAKLEHTLSRLVVTPSIHWVHHHAVREHTDSNYATVLSFWDVIFGTRSPWQRQLDMKIGVANENELKLTQLLIKPFKG